MNPIKVLIVDDHTLFRKGLINVLQQQPGIDVVGEAKDGMEGTELAQSLNPDYKLSPEKYSTWPWISAGARPRSAAGWA